MIHALAEELLRSGEVGGAGLRGRPEEALLDLQGDRQSEVRDLNNAGAIFDQEVLGLEVPVHQAALVGVIEGAESIEEDLDDTLSGYRSLRLNDACQVAPPDVLHRVPDQTRTPADVVRVGDVRVHDLCGHSRFAPEALDHAGIDGQIRVQDFQGDLPFEREVPNEVHPTEAAGAEFLDPDLRPSHRASRPR
jgi:hypothetical protein